MGDRSGAGPGAAGAALERDDTGEAERDIRPFHRPRPPPTPCTLLPLVPVLGDSVAKGFVGKSKFAPAKPLVGLVFLPLSTHFLRKCVEISLLTGGLVTVLGGVSPWRAHRGYPASSSNNVLASWRSAVSKPSVNQP